MPLSAPQLQEYDRDGFLVLPGFFSPLELQPVIAEVEGLVDCLAERLYSAGQIRNRHVDAPFETRLALLEEQHPGAALLVQPTGGPGPALAHLWETSRLLDVIEQVLGPEIAGHPAWNIRSKTPNNPLVTVPWHQDRAYLAAGCHTALPTAWIPLVDANRMNGTIEVVRGGHRSGQVLPHRPEYIRGYDNASYFYLPAEELPEGEIVTCEMSRGSVLLINDLVPHRSTENRSDRIRWSIDLRWQRPTDPTGLEGSHGCILMRTARDPNHRADWENWAKEEQSAAGQAAMQV